MVGVRRHRRGGLQVWQGKDLRERVFGSVAMIGLTGEFFGSVARKELSKFLEGGKNQAARD